MRKLVIIPGGFHPFHAGHKALYDAAQAAFPSAEIYVAATADTSNRPFPFEVKQKLAHLAGIPKHRFIQVRSPFQAREITQHFDPNDTQLIFVRSEKDREQQPQAGGVKRDGTPGYLQPYKRNGLAPMTQHGYMAYLPVVQFADGMTSATEIRAKWPEMQPEQKAALINKLYPATQGNDRLIDVVVKMFDTVMAPSEPKVKEAVLINDPDAGVQIQPDGGMGTWDEASLVSNLARKFADMVNMVKNQNYQGLYHVLYKSGATENMVRALAELEGFQKQQGRRPIARGRSIDLTDYLDEKRTDQETTNRD
jgi:hypothetical protein